MIEFQNIECDPKINKKCFSFWLNEMLIEENKVLGDIVYVFCDDDYLLTKNIKYLNHNILTDVITFDYSKDKLISGDILISLDRVRENANTFKVHFLNELQRVMAHGLLHLLGYNDKTEKGKQEMQKKEDYYLNKFPN
ncbi:rRNA maturation RNase YbeY [Flavobacteriales bacterium]|nr:rRNA maturation RNase YbeY [Flavobacteriales bacterium]